MAFVSMSFVSFLTPCKPRSYIPLFYCIARRKANPKLLMHFLEMTEDLKFMRANALLWIRLPYFFPLSVPHSFILP